MCLADAGITFVWVGGILLVGFVGFFVMIVAAVGRVLRFIARFVRGRGVRPAAPTLTGPAQRVCGHPRCGHLNPRDARYCARCGSALGALGNVDDYG